MKEAIVVDNLSKRYRLGVQVKGEKTFAGQIFNLVKAPFENFKRLASLSNFKDDDSSVFWALKEISFQVNQGEVLGVIGKNGAGKSTLLKILSRITDPTTGSVKIQGRVASLLEVGTGFHPELTGRENVYMNGTILGMRRKEIDRKFDEILDFSGVEKFIDTPVKFYSSGMKVRLGFAVAAHLDPEILIVDEVLAVGDAEFQKKCIHKMQDVSKGQGRTVLFVSHSMASIKKLCTSCLILGQGHLEFIGSTDTAVEKYLNLNTEVDDEFPAIITREVIRKSMDGVKDDTPFLTLNQITILNRAGNPSSTFTSNEPIFIKFDFDVHFIAPDFRIVVSIVDFENNSILNSQLSDSIVHESTIRPGTYSAVCSFPENLFATNTYFLSVHVINVRKEHYIFNGIIKFRVQYENPKYLYAPFDQTFFRPQLEWQLTRKEE